jgi:two-component system response regulator PilR (NtrC family)
MHVRSLSEALVEVGAESYPVVLADLCDLQRPAEHEQSTTQDKTDAYQLSCLAEIRRISPQSQCVVLVHDKPDLRTCCQAVSDGVSGFVDYKPGDSTERLEARLMDAYCRHLAVMQGDESSDDQTLFQETGIAGESQAMARVLFQAKRAARVSDAPILIHGESGTGKQLLAEAIHRMDPKRHGAPFFSVNCAAITGTLAESALFGHRKGAFTGATDDRQGYFRAADGGTLLLDEVSELPKSLQPKLLRVLQEGQVLPVGKDREHKVDVRVIAASNRQLEVMVEKGDFRMDLFQRLNVISLTIPPLRDRPEDIPPLVRFFVRQYANYYPRPIEYIDDRVYEVLAASIGSGNVRELENAVRQILAFKTAGTHIELSDIPPDILERHSLRKSQRASSASLSSVVKGMLHTGEMTLGDMLSKVEVHVLQEALSGPNKSYTELASQLGLSRRTFYNKLQKYDLVKRRSS